MYNVDPQDMFQDRSDRFITLSRIRERALSVPAVSKRGFGGGDASKAREVPLGTYQGWRKRPVVNCWGEPLPDWITNTERPAIYFIRATVATQPSELYCCKIGFSTKLRQRLLSLVQCPIVKLSLLCAVYRDDAAQAEVTLHQAYDAYNAGGEWFMFTDEQIADVINTMQRGIVQHAG